MPDDIITKKDYAVGTGQNEVRLAVTIGEGQFGTSRARLAGSLLATASGPLNVLVGRRDDIKGKELLIRTIVHDINSNTNAMSVSYRLSGGAQAQKTVAKGKVATDNDLLVFETRFALV